MHTVGGRVEAASDGSVPTQATISLLYADDRERARKTAIDKDGNFSFSYVPDDNYILRVSDAETVTEDSTAKDSPNAAGTQAAPQVQSRFLDKDIPLRVQSDLSDVDVPLTVAPAAKPQ